MKRPVIIDEFFSDQPELLFIKDLTKPYHEAPTELFGKREIEEGEVSVDGLYLKKDFPDEKGLLDTAYEDFEVFTDLYKIDGKRFPVITKKIETSRFEEYYLEITDTEIIISAGDTEGIRRGIYLLEDELKASEAPFLKKGKTHKFPYVKKRITRGFFSPTNRPPKNGDELSDDIDYYPEEYLNRLAHDGTNGLWIYTKFFDIIPSAVIPEYGQGYEKRIEKLNRVCDRCEKYGIGVYVFAIEPMLPPAEIRDKYTDLIGGNEGFRTPYSTPFCTHTKRGREFCIDATKKLCELVPKMVGYISITAGERPTSCGAVGAVKTCPYCGHKTRGESIGQTLDCLKEGIRQSGRDVEFISWTYGHRGWPDEEITDYVKNAPSDVVLMQNFEDRGMVEQLGKMRQAIDYWLSYPGPSQMFVHTAEKAKEYKKTMYAKMQICSSHEIATLPYIPSPAHVFEKMKGAYEYGVEGIMECWYFGNYPSIMSKAAGDWSFCNDFSDKDALLLKLAESYCGRTNAPKLLEAWKHFEKGYSSLPVNIMFSYYGPMHDGIVWDLHVKPKNFSTPRSWLLLDKPDGDRIRDSLLCGHTLEEAIFLIDEMKSEFEKGKEILGNALIPAEHESVINAITILARSGSNILNFYKKREQIAFGEGDALTLLYEMKAIVEDEIKNSLEMCALCENDGRLGYHSEAEGYKFFPKKILKRVEWLKSLFETEFPEIEERIKNGLAPYEYYLGVEPDTKHYDLIYGDISEAEWQWVGNVDGGSKFCASYDDDRLYIRIVFRGGWSVLTPEFKPFFPYPSFQIEKDQIRFNHETKANYALIGDEYDKELAKWNFQKLEDGWLISVDRKAVGWTEDTPLKLKLTLNSASWENEPNPVITLGKNHLTPGQFGWLMPKKKDK